MKKPEYENQKFLALLRLKINKANEDKAAEIINHITERIRVKKGCTTFRYYNDFKDKDLFLLVQEWESKNAFKKHLHSNEFRLVLALIDLASEFPEISFNTISREEGLELISSFKEGAS